MRNHLARYFGPFAALSLFTAGAILLVSSEPPAFTPREKAFYADPRLVDFVRPGLVIDILGAEIASDGTIRARLKITDPQGLPLDREGITTPGAVNMSLVAAFLPANEEQYVSYTTRVQTSPITNVSATQAAADTGGTWRRITDGEYEYTFGRRAPANADRGATHSLGVYGSRNLTEFDLGTQYDDDVFTFVPAGGDIRHIRDVVRTESCNKCHDFDEVGVHGGSRKSMELCILCHTPQTTDPDTGNTVDMPVMIHRIHTGEDLPSVQAGIPYRIIGNQQSVHDFSHVVFPVLNQDRSGVVDCAACHERANESATQKNDYLTEPTRKDCGSCHDNVNFATGENHADLPQVTDNQCASCHIVEGELAFDVSIKGAHAIPELVAAAREGINFEILEVSGRAGQRPTVRFSIKDNSGTPIPLARFNTSPGRVALLLAGPTADYGYTQFGANPPVGYVSENPVPTASCDSNGVCTYTFTNAVPAAATGSYSVGIEGRLGYTINPGTRSEVTTQYGGVNKVAHFSVDGGTAMPRRTVATIENCNQCHGELRVHGQNRNRVEMCVLCHNPSETDALRRPANQKPDQTVQFAYMIHRIHAGEQVEGEYTVYGFGGAAHDFSHVLFPARLSRCDNCHTSGSQNIDGKDTLNKVVTPRSFLNPTSPITAACGSCHTSQAAWSHALANTTQLGEACAVCHGQNSEFSVDKAHAR
jgi:OmcA/MtrC family decaheme c-type cytochrome